MTDTVSSNNLTSLYGSTDTNVNLATPSDPTLDSSIASKNFTTLYSGGGADPIPVTVVGNTTYNIASAATGGGGNLLLTGSDGSSDFVTFASGTGITVSSTDSSTILITNTNPAGTTYAINASTVAGGANLNLTGSDASTDAVKFASGTGITVTRTDADTITITNSSPGSAGVTSITGTANQVIASASTGAVTLSTPQNIATTSSPTFASLTLTGDLDVRGSDITNSTGGINITTTSNNNILLDPNGSGRVQVNSDIEATGNGNFNGEVIINNDQTATNPSYQAYSGASLGSLTWNGTLWDATGGINSDGGEFGNITVGVVTDNTISTTTGDLTITSAGSYVNINQIVNITADYLNLNSDDTVNNAAIRFGNSSELTYNRTLDQFEFNKNTNFDLAVNVEGALTVQADVVTINSDKTNFDTYVKFGRVAPNNDAAIRWNATTNRFEFNADGTSVSNWSPFVQTLDDLSDVIITTPGQGNLFYYNGTNFVNSSTIATSVAGNRPVFQYNNTGAGINSVLTMRKNRGATPFADGDGPAFKFEVDSDSQAANEFALISGGYSPTQPGVAISTSIDDGANYTTNMSVGTFGVDVWQSELSLNRAQTGAPTLNALITANRGSSPDAALRWNEGTDRWQFTNDGTTFYDMADNGGHIFGNVTVGIDTVQTISTTSGNLVLQTAAGVDAGTITLANGANAAITIAPNGTGDVVLSADTVQIGDLNTNAALTTNGTGDLILNTNNGTNSGQITILDGASGNITFVPNGTGNVVNTFSNGGNLTNNRNYVLGAIRNSTTAGLGEVFTLGPSGTGFKGISLDNSADTVDGPMTIMRSFTGGAVAGAGTRGRLVFERARGTSASPTAVQAADQLGSVDGTGYTTTGYLADTLAVQPILLTFAAAENWVSNTNLGTTASLLMAPTATTITTGANLVSVIAANPQTFASRSDAYTWSQGKTGSTQNMALDVNGNLTVTGDVRINGNDIQNSAGTAVISMTSGNTQTTVNSTAFRVIDPVSLSTYNSVNSVLLNGGNPAGAGFNDRIGQLRVNTASTTAGEASTITFNTGNYNTGTKVYSATQSGNTLGEFFFAGNYGTTADFTTLGPSVRFKGVAAENFTGSASGGQFVVSLDKIGGTTQYDAVSVSSANAVIASNALTLTDNSSVNLVGSKITYNRVYGQFEYNTTVTPAAINTAYVFPLGTAITNNIATVGSTSRLIPGAAGVYNIQFSAQVKNNNSQEHTAYIFLVKNGTAVTNSTGQVTILRQSSQIVSWNYLITSANTTDYFEIGYAVDNTQITFPAFAATAFAPSAASIITTLTPVGA